MKVNTQKTYYIYFGPSQFLNDGTNLFNKYAVLHGETLEKATKKMKKYFPNIKAYLSEDFSMATRFCMKPISLNYFLKNNL